MIVSVDFDGTITQASEPYEDGFNKIRPYCKNAINILSKLGVEFFLLTGRKPEYLQEAVDLCKEWGLNIDCSHPNTKGISDLYIDDKNLSSIPMDWRLIFAHILMKLLEEGNNEESATLFGWN